MLQFAKRLSLALGAVCIVGGEYRLGAEDKPQDTTAHGATVASGNSIKKLPRDLHQKVYDLQVQARILLASRKFDEARPLHAEALSILKDNLGESHSLSRIVRAYQEFHEWCAGLSESEFSELMAGLEQIQEGSDLLRERKHVAAVEAFEKGTQIIESFKSLIAFQASLHFQTERARALAEAGQLAKAIDVGRATEQRVRDLVGEQSLQFADILWTLGLVEGRMGDEYAQIRRCAEACSIVEACGEGESAYYFQPLFYSLEPLIELEEYDLAKRRIAHAKALAANCLPADSQPAHGILYVECAWLCAQHEDDEALKKMSELVASMNRANGQQHEEYIGTAFLRGLISLRSGNIEQASRLIRGTCDTCFVDPNISENCRIQYYNAYAQLLIAENQTAEAARFLGEVFRAVEFRKVKDIQLRKTLKLYVEVLTALGKDDLAKEAEARRLEICAEVEEMRRRIRNDPKCKLSWE